MDRLRWRGRQKSTTEGGKGGMKLEVAGLSLLGRNGCGR